MVVGLEFSLPFYLLPSVIILLTSLLTYVCQLFLKDANLALFRKKNVLFVTAHPDDECIFFSPCIINLGRYSTVRLLCLTSGNYYKQGEVRKQELLASCGILGIPSCHVTVVDNHKLPDDPHEPWDIKAAGNIINDHIKQNNIQVVVTFDLYGVSGHNNHIDTFKAMKNLKEEGGIKGVKVYTLASVNIVRKYLSFLDLPFSFFSRNLFTSSPQDVLLAQRAMCAHASQLVWFRKLYIVFSRFMVINTLDELQ